MSGASASWHVPDIVRGLLQRLEGETGEGWVNGRLVSVVAGPADDSSSEMSFGFSVIPSGRESEEHSHRAEELAVVLQGTGEIIVDGDTNEVGPMDAVLAPPWSPHTTRSTGKEPLVVLWVYAPAGSEARWLQQGDEK